MKYLLTASILRVMASEFVIQDMNKDKVKIKPAVRHSGNRALNLIVTNKYFKEIPLDEIFEALEKIGLIAVQEDGTRWSGFLTGASGQAHIRLAFEGKLVDNSLLALSWYKTDKGHWEVVAYLS